MRGFWASYTTTLWPAGLFVFLFFLVEQYSGPELQRPAHRLFNVLYMLHHSDRAMNSSTAQRHALTHYVLYSVLWTPMLLIFAGLPMNLAVAFVMFHSWGFVNHADLRWHFGRMTIVFSGPHWHHIHHSRLPEHRDKNFAAFFPVIDRLFGTYYRPALDEYPPTGLVGDADLFELGAALASAPQFLNLLGRQLAGSG